MAENTVSLFYYNFNPMAIRNERPRKFRRTFNHFNLQFNSIELLYGTFRASLKLALHVESFLPSENIHI